MLVCSFMAVINVRSLNLLEFYVVLFGISSFIFRYVSVDIQYVKSKKIYKIECSLYLLCMCAVHHVCSWLSQVFIISSLAIKICFHIENSPAINFNLISDHHLYVSLHTWNKNVVISISCKLSLKLEHKVSFETMAPFLLSN